MEELTPQFKKIDPVGLSLYGAVFLKWNRIADYKDFIPAFKDYYYQEKIKNPKITLSQLLQFFNATVVYPEGKTFHPSTPQLRTWRRKWDRDINEKRIEQGLETHLITTTRDVQQLVKTREEGKIILGAPQDNELEAGVRTLGGELLNDAMTMLRDDQELEDIYSDETLMKRRNYIINVFSHTTRLVHGKAALLLKASAEKRENAGFLMNLLAKATSGKLSDEEMGMLETTYSPKGIVETPKHNEPVNTQ